jgi:NADPH:quinone reductase-like Zn-dependent oxidoreductase
VSGTDAAVGERITRFAVGDPVVGTQERLDRPLGTQAQYVILEDPNSP